MRKILINTAVGIAMIFSMASCGDKFLETELPNGIDTETALDNVDNIGYALNGTYYQLMYYYFSGNYATMIGDIASDITYWNQQTQHWNNMYMFDYQVTDNYLTYIWEFGYKVVDNSARVVQAAQRLLDKNPSEEDEVYLMIYEAEARCLRAYANLAMVNIFCHQAMVAGNSYLSQPGLVLVETPIVPYTQVERATIGETYNFIIDDLQTAIDLFEELGFDRGDVFYFNLPAAYGLLARANLYIENWGAAATAASNALAAGGISTLCYTPQQYMALYDGGDSNDESFFTLGINDIDNFSANSCGTLFTTYGFSCSPYLLSLYGEDDCRLSLLYFNNGGDPANDYKTNFSGGKFWYGGGNAASATNYLINAPEMFLIQAEAFAQQGSIQNAVDNLFVVAHRNPAIASPADLPQSKEGILEFLHEERARELFQEGLRLWDLRRWNITCNLASNDAPSINFFIKNVTVGNQVFPIPADEINTGFGVTQNEGWSESRPK